MNKQTEINYNKKVNLAYPYPKPNAININTHNTIQHEVVKAMVVFVLKKRGFETYSEAQWASGGGVADVYIPEINAYVEVLQSETEAKLRIKTSKYPKHLTQIVIYVNDLPSGDMELMFDRISEILPERD